MKEKKNETFQGVLCEGIMPRPNLNFTIGLGVPISSNGPILSMFTIARLCVRAFLGALSITPCQSFLYPSLAIYLVVTLPIKLKRGQIIGGKVQKKTTEE
jgi:hypothetical protein